MIEFITLPVIEFVALVIEFIALASNKLNHCCDATSTVYICSTLSMLNVLYLSSSLLKLNLVTILTGFIDQQMHCELIRRDIHQSIAVVLPSCHMGTLQKCCSMVYSVQNNYSDMC